MVKKCAAWKRSDFSGLGQQFYPSQPSISFRYSLKYSFLRYKKKELWKYIRGDSVASHFSQTKCFSQAGHKRRRKNQPTKRDPARRNSFSSSFENFGKTMTDSWHCRVCGPLSSFLPFALSLLAFQSFEIIFFFAGYPFLTSRDGKDVPPGKQSLWLRWCLIWPVSLMKCPKVIDPIWLHIFLLSRIPSSICCS